MNYKDIKKLTSRSNYNVQWGLDQILFNIDALNEKLLDKNGKETDTDGLILNPDFQRGHVWTEEQQIKFVEYLFRGGMSGRDIYFNNASHLNNYEDPYLCVDGLQRLTACMKFARNELKIFGHYKKDFEGFIPQNVFLNVYINDLKTRKEVLQWYLELNTEGTPHETSELERIRTLLEKE